MTDKNYHPDGFVPMQTELFDDFKAMERGIEFFADLKSGAGNTVPSGAGATVQMSQSEYDALMRFKENHMRLFKNWVDGIRTPLTDELIKDIQAMCHLKNVGYDTFIMRFARSVERAHGIV